jgi:hypothetical protein
MFVSQNFEQDFMGTMRVVMDGAFRVVMASASDLMKAVPQATVSLHVDNPKELLNVMTQLLGNVNTVTDAKRLANLGVKVWHGMVDARGDKRGTVLVTPPGYALVMFPVNDTIVFGVKASYLCKGNAAMESLKTINVVTRDSKIDAVLDLLAVVNR